eukprot:1549118-Pyramimonas_sp.AAC.1
MFVLSCLGLPDILLTFIGRLYEAIEGVASLKGEFVRLFWIRSGIVQGDALSGSLYALGTAAFLWDLAACIDGDMRGLIRACADDIGG